MVKYLWIFKVRKSNLWLMYFLSFWMDPEGPAASVWPEFHPCSFDSCEDTDKVFTGTIIAWVWQAGNVPMLSPLQAHCSRRETLGVYWGCSNRIPLKAKLKEQGAQFWAAFWEKLSYFTAVFCTALDSGWYYYLSGVFYSPVPI